MPLINASKWRDAAWLPAVMLILVQTLSGMRDIPQFAFFLIYLQEQLGLPPKVISSVVAGAQIAGMITALLGGAIIARLGAKWVIVAGLTLTGLSSLAFQVPLPGLVPVLWFLGGAGGALVTVGGASYMTQIGARGELGMLAAFYMLSITIGGAVGNPAAGVIIEQFGFKAFSWSAITLSAVIILSVLLWMAPMRERKADSGSFHSIWSGVFSTVRLPNVRLVIGMRSLPTIFYGMLTVLIPLLLYGLSGSKVLVAAYGTTTLIVASAAQLLAGRSADRWGARLPTITAYTVLILSGFALAAGSGKEWSLFVFGVIGNAAAWSLSTLMYVWVNDGVPKAEHPATFGLLHAIWSLSMITGSVIGGWLVSSFPALPFLAGGLLNIGSFFFLLSYYKRNSVRRALPDSQSP